MKNTLRSLAAFSGVVLFSLHAPATQAYGPYDGAKHHAPPAHWAGAPHMVRHHPAAHQFQRQRIPMTAMRGERSQRWGGPQRALPQPRRPQQAWNSYRNQPRWAGARADRGFHPHAQQSRYHAPVAQAPRGGHPWRMASAQYRPLQGQPPRMNQGMAPRQRTAANQPGVQWRPVAYGGGQRFVPHRGQPRAAYRPMVRQHPAPQAQAQGWQRPPHMVQWRQPQPRWQAAPQRPAYAQAPHWQGNPWRQAVRPPMHQAPNRQAAQMQAPRNATTPDQAYAWRHRWQPDGA